MVPEHVGAQLRRLRNQVLLTQQVLDDWEFRRLCPSTAGVTALFAGPSGTGKTMAAQVLARSLGLELYRVDLAERRQQVHRRDREAPGGGVRRVRAQPTCCCSSTRPTRCSASARRCNDAHDRFANIEIDYLLQRMEQFDGVAVLATNRKGDLDSAFLRRLRLIVDFVAPARERAAAAVAARAAVDDVDRRADHRCPGPRVAGDAPRTDRCRDQVHRAVGGVRCPRGRRSDLGRARTRRVAARAGQARRGVARRTADGGRDMTTAHLARPAQPAHRPDVGQRRAPPGRAGRAGPGPDDATADGHRHRVGQRAAAAGPQCRADRRALSRRAIEAALRRGRGALMSGFYLRGALVEFMPTGLIPIPNIIVFQYNPEIDDSHVDAARGTGRRTAIRRRPIPLAVKGNPGESFSLHARRWMRPTRSPTVSPLRPSPKVTGVYSRLAALEMLLYPASATTGGSARHGDSRDRLGVRCERRRRRQTEPSPRTRSHGAVRVGSRTYRAGAGDRADRSPRGSTTPCSTRPTPRRRSPCGCSPTTSSSTSPTRWPDLANAAYTYSQGLRQALARRQPGQRRRVHPRHAADLRIAMFYSNSRYAKAGTYQVTLDRRHGRGRHARSRGRRRAP